MTAVKNDDESPRFTLRQLSYLVAISDAGSIVGAAKSVHVAPSTMSDAITELERLLGVQLCVRRKAHGLSMTSVGLRAVADARKVLRDAREMQFALSAAGDRIAGPLTVGCYSAIGPTIVPLLLGSFSTEHPGVQVDVVESTLDRLVELLDTGRLDIAFVCDPYVPARLSRRKLYELPAFAVLAQGHPLADAPDVRLEDLIEEDFFMLDAPPTTEHALAHFSARGLSPRIRHRTANRDVIRMLVGRGLGYSLLVQRLPVVGSNDFPVVMKPLHPRPKPMVVEIVWPEGVELSARAAALVSFAETMDWPQPPAELR